MSFRRAEADYMPMMEMNSKSDFLVTSTSPPPRRPSPVTKRMIAFVVFLGILTVVLVILQFCIRRNSEVQTIKASDAPCSGNCTIKASDAPCPGNCTGNCTIKASDAPCSGNCTIKALDTPCSGNCTGNCTIKASDAPCSGNCTITLVESIPENVKFPAGSISNPSIYNGWMNLLKIAKHEIHIASFYWTLKGSDTKTTDPSTKEGENVLQSLEAAAKRGVKIRIVQTPPNEQFPSLDTIELQKKGLAEVRLLDMTRLTGGGILHTKMWLVDGKHFYVGSANQDWRALTQVQELGLMTYNCSCLGDDMSKIFEVYWDLAQRGSKIPDPWPDKYKTSINADSPAQIKINGSESAAVFFSSSPNQLCPPGRSEDLATILQVINSAKKFVYVSVMDYFPTTLYTEKRTYWPVIDDALRRAAFDRKVQVRLMASLWNHTRPDMKLYLKSLAALDGANDASIQVKLYKVPPYSKEIPYSRVNHNKYMVTESVAYIGTSNWSADYFANTGGIGYVINETDTGNTVRARLQAVFERNWNSTYTTPLYCKD